MGRRRTRSAAQLAGVAAVLVLAAGSAAAAGSGSGGRGASLRAQAGSLEARTHRALLDLYALDTRLHAAQARLGALETQAAQLRAQQADLSRQVSATRRTLAVSRQRLGDSLRTLYKQGDVSALAVVLGAQSLDDAVSQLDDLNHLAEQSREVVAVTTRAQVRLARLRTTLALRRAQIDTAVASARATAAALAAASSERLAFVAQLRNEQRLKAAQIAALETTAQHAEVKSQELTASAVAGNAALQTPAADPGPTAGGNGGGAPAPAAPPAPPSGRTLTVSSTGYSLPGRTATGMPVGWGVVAVDPAVIPLGTRLTIPGYGEGVAADVGSAVRGLDIDLWFPTLGQARAWGRRTVTITLH